MDKIIFSVSVLFILAGCQLSTAVDEPKVEIKNKPGETIPNSGDTVNIICEGAVLKGTEKLSSTANLITLEDSDIAQKPIVKTNRYSKIQDKMGEISIKGVKPADGGFYACTSFSLTDGFTKSPKIELLVRDSPTVSIEGKRADSTVTIKEMDSLTIDCKASGKFKNTKLSVKIGDEDITDKLKKEASFSWNPLKPIGLTLMNPRWTGSVKGSFTVGAAHNKKKVICTASVGDPKLDKSYSFTLDVKANPKKMNCSVDKTSVDLGETVKYSCLLASIPAPMSVEWFYKYRSDVSNLTSPGQNDDQMIIAEQEKADDTHIRATLKVKMMYEYMLEMQNFTLKVVNSFGSVEHIFQALPTSGRSTAGANYIHISIATLLLVIMTFIFNRD